MTTLSHPPTPPLSGADAAPPLWVRRVVNRAGAMRKQLLRGVKSVRKQFARRLQVLTHGTRSARKSLFFRLRESQVGRFVLTQASPVQAREVRARARVAAPYVARLDTSVPVIDPAGGYVLLPGDAAALAPVLSASRAIFAQKKAEMDAQFAGFESWSRERKEKYLSRKQSFLRYLLNDEDLRRHPELVDFALSDAMLGAVTRYLGIVPFLTRVDLMYSLPRDGDDRIGSQLFHLDHEGVTQVKVFVNIFDVGEAEGPFSFIPADVSTRVMRQVRENRRASSSNQDVEARRYTDADVAAAGGDRALLAVTGRAGSGVAVDTSRCLHLGSRVAPGTFRLCLYLQYCTTREWTHVFDVDRFAGDPVRHLAVAHCIEPGRGRASDHSREMMAG